MFQKILVAIDKSDISVQALDEALALARSTNAQLKLVHVLNDRDPDQPPFPYSTEFRAYTTLDASLLDIYQREYKAFVDQSWEWLKTQANRAIEAGVATEYEQPSGSAGYKICTLAEKWDADLIMIGSRCLRGWKELILGSVSNYVVHHASCSVCVIHPRQTPAHQSDTQTSDRNEATVEQELSVS